MRIHDFSGADFEPVSKLLGSCHHAQHGGRAYWHGANELCVCLYESDHGLVAEDDSGAPVGVVLLSSPRDEDHNSELRMHWRQQQTMILTVCRSLGINLQAGLSAQEGKAGAPDEPERVAQLLGSGATDLVRLFATAKGPARERVEAELAQAARTWLVAHGAQLEAPEPGDLAPVVLASSDADSEAVGLLLNSHAKRQGVDFVPYNYHVAQDGEVVAGITAWSLGSDVHVDMLAVREDHRREGLGSLLLSHVEAQARKDGCTTASLDTFSWQAPDFYPAHGYEVVFRYTLDDGTERIYFSKRL